MRLPTFFAATLLALLPAAVMAEQPVHVGDAYARLGPDSGAVFFVLKNNTGADVTLVSAETDIANKAELHSHSESADGVMVMAQIEGGVAVAAGGTHEFARGGDHVMLMGLADKPEDGATFDLTLVFADGARVTVPVVVDNARKPGAATGHGMDHGMDGEMDHGAMHGSGSD